MDETSFISKSDSQLSDWREQALAIERHAAQVIIGQAAVIRKLNTALFATGHVLLQGDVGVGKTTLLRAFARLIGGAFARAEGTIDLMPNDLIYHTHIGADGRPAVDPGPLVAHGEELAVFFFNEINRARPQVHALLLRVMAERSLTAFNRELNLPHLLVFADRNRVEREETFEISSAARDRFMMEITIEAPSCEASRAAVIFDPRFHDVDRLLSELPEGVLSYRDLMGVGRAIQQHVSTSDALREYALNLWRATATPSHFGVRVEVGDLAGTPADELILAGASPRGMSLLLRAARVTAWLAGRDYVAPEDLRTVFDECIAHRLCLQPVYELRRPSIVEALMSGIINQVAAP